MTDTIIKSEQNRALETKVYALNGMTLLIIWQKLHKKFSLISGEVGKICATHIKREQTLQAVVIYHSYTAF